MELWIRSQDKEHLTKVCDVDLGYEDKRAVLINNYVMGRYKTKERALEVIDEIQRLLKGLYMEYSGVATIATETNKLVYEMPKE